MHQNETWQIYAIGVMYIVILASLKPIYERLQRVRRRRIFVRLVDEQRELIIELRKMRHITEGFIVWPGHDNCARRADVLKRRAVAAGLSLRRVLFLSDTDSVFDGP
jgi:hypothetical protein